jgi:hypothetical protein
MAFWWISSWFSDREMWEFALKTKSLEDPEYQAENLREIARMRLTEDPTAQQMKDHMEGFNGLLLKVSCAGLRLREAESIDRFLVTLPKSFEAFRMQFRVSNQSGRTWSNVRKEYNREQNARNTGVYDERWYHVTSYGTLSSAPQMYCSLFLGLRSTLKLNGQVSGASMLL